MQTYMRRTLLLFIILLGLTRCTPKLNISELKDYKSIEKAKIGMPINSAIGIAKKKFFIEKKEKPGYEGEAKEYEYVVYKDDSKKVTLFSFNSGYDNKTKDKVFRLAIKNTKYRTVEGVFTGMTLKKLKERTKLKSADFNYDDGLFLISDTFDGGFLMDISTLKDSKYTFAKPQISTLPSELKIKEIIIF